MKRLILVLVLLAPGAAWAQSYSDLPAIDRAVAAFAGAAIGQPGGAAQPVDRRMHLAGCAAPLALSWYGSRRDTVLVQCPDPASWRIFVPLVASAAPGNDKPAVLRGESVTIAVTGEGFSVSQAGEAMEPGAVGAWIRVRAASANAQPIRARIIRPGLVAVEMFGGSGSGLP